MLLLLTPYPHLQKAGNKTLASANGKDEIQSICKLATGSLVKEIPLIDITECKLAVDSNLPDYLLENWEASSRFLFILISANISTALLSICIILVSSKSPPPDAFVSV